MSSDSFQELSVEPASLPTVEIIETLDDEDNVIERECRQINKSEIDSLISVGLRHKNNKSNTAANNSNHYEDLWNDKQTVSSSGSGEFSAGLKQGFLLSKPIERADLPENNTQRDHVSSKAEECSSNSNALIDVQRNKNHSSNIESSASSHLKKEVRFAEQVCVKEIESSQTDVQNTDELENLVGIIDELELISDEEDDEYWLEEEENEFGSSGGTLFPFQTLSLGKVIWANNIQNIQEEPQVETSSSDHKIDLSKLYDDDSLETLYKNIREYHNNRRSGNNSPAITSNQQFSATDNTDVNFGSWTSSSTSEKPSDVQVKGCGMNSPIVVHHGNESSNFSSSLETSQTITCDVNDTTDNNKASEDVVIEDIVVESSGQIEEQVGVSSKTRRSRFKSERCNAKHDLPIAR